MLLGEQINSLLNEIQKSLAASPNKETLLSFLRDVYKPGATFQQVFAQMLNRLFQGSGLVIASVDDARLKKLCVPLFQQEVTQYREITRILESTSSKLEAKYHAQVRVHPTNLFMMDDTSRQPIDAVTEGFHLRGNGQFFRPAGPIRSHPEPT